MADFCYIYIYIFQAICHAINVLKLMFLYVYLNIRPYAIHANNSRQKILENATALGRAKELYIGVFSVFIEPSRPAQ